MKNFYFEIFKIAFVIEGILNAKSDEEMDDAGLILIHKKGDDPD